MVQIQFARIREGAVIPSKREEDSDYDLYACFEEEEFVIPAFSTRLIPTGLVSAFDSGLGVKFEPSWGLMISNGQSLFWRGAWWEIAAATGFMFVLVLALNMTGDALRDALDPRHTSGK